jgi:hypothetical protein
LAFQRKPIKNDGCCEEGHQWGDARRKRRGQYKKLELEDGSLLEVEWTKELMYMFTLSEGVSEPWLAAILVFTLSNNTLSLCITHPFVIFS